MSVDGPDSAGGSDPDATTDASGPGEQPDVSALAARVERLTAENERLRREHARARRGEHRRAAQAMALLGLLALAGAALLDRHGDVLLALSGTGLFGAVLTYYLAPTRYVPAAVGERVHDARADTLAALVEELGLEGSGVYVPTPGATQPVGLFVPQRADYSLPESVEGLFVVADSATGRGLALPPTGAPLYAEFEASTAGEPASEPARLAQQLAETAVDAFELAGDVRVEPDRSGGRLVVAASDTLFGDPGDIDHPLVSLVGVGLARTVDGPVTADVVESDGTNVRVVYEWG